MPKTLPHAVGRQRRKRRGRRGSRASHAPFLGIRGGDPDKEPLAGDVEGHSGLRWLGGSTHLKDLTVGRTVRAPLGYMKCLSFPPRPSHPNWGKDGFWTHLEVGLNRGSVYTGCVSFEDATFPSLSFLIYRVEGRAHRGKGPVRCARKAPAERHM